VTHTLRIAIAGAVFGATAGLLEVASLRSSSVAFAVAASGIVVVPYAVWGAYAELRYWHGMRSYRATDRRRRMSAESVPRDHR
jgi:hypothetical protein